MILYYIYLYYTYGWRWKRISLYSKPAYRKKKGRKRGKYIFISFLQMLSSNFLDIMNIQHFQQRWVCKAYKVNSGYTMHNLNATFTPARKTRAIEQKKKENYKAQHLKKKEEKNSGLFGLTRPRCPPMSYGWCAFFSVSCEERERAPRSAGAGELFIHCLMNNGWTKTK